MKIKLDEGAFMPERAHRTDAGADLKSPKRATVRPYDSCVIDTGVHVEIPEGYVGMLKSRSGLNIKNGIIGEGTIDAGYTGSIKVKLYNMSETDKTIKKGDKIIQLVIMPVVTPEFELVDELEETERGDKGIGSSGR